MYDGLQASSLCIVVDPLGWQLDNMSLQDKKTKDSSKLASFDNSDIEQYDFDFSTGLFGFVNGIIRPTLKISGIRRLTTERFIVCVRYSKTLGPRCFCMIAF